MNTPIWNTLMQQHTIAWSLLQYHLDEMGNDECLWKPRHKGLFVNADQNRWTTDWPESEGYDIGPPNIAWLTWHIIFWWSMTINHSFSDGTLKREDIQWPGSIHAAKETILHLHDEWATQFGKLSDGDLVSTERTKWPFENKPFSDVAAWLNLELMKNASEIGYCRFLYATRE